MFKVFQATLNVFWKPVKKLGIGVITHSPYWDKIPNLAVFFLKASFRTLLFSDNPRYGDAFAAKIKIYIFMWLTFVQFLVEFLILVWHCRQVANTIRYCCKLKFPRLFLFVLTDGVTVRRSEWEQILKNQYK